MSTPADHTAHASDSSTVPPVQETSYLSCPEGRIGYDVAGGGSLVMLVPGMAGLPGRLQPAGNVVPLVRRDVVARDGPRLLAVLNTVSAHQVRQLIGARLSTGSLHALDARVELRGRIPAWCPGAGCGCRGWPRWAVRRVEREDGDGNGTGRHREPSAGSRRAASAPAPDGRARARRTHDRIMTDT